MSYVESLQGGLPKDTGLDLSEQDQALISRFIASLDSGCTVRFLRNPDEFGDGPLWALLFQGEGVKGYRPPISVTRTVEAYTAVSWCPLQVEMFGCFPGDAGPQIADLFGFIKEQLASLLV